MRTLWYERWPWTFEYQTERQALISNLESIYNKHPINFSDISKNPVVAFMN